LNQDYIPPKEWKIEFEEQNSQAEEIEPEIEEI
jgi:hypothetical protein